MARPKFTISRHVGRFSLDRRTIIVLILIGAFVAGRGWLAENPQHDPWAPLDLRDPPGWATQRKIQALRGDVDRCRAVLARSDVDFTALPPTGEGQCARPDRTRLDGYPFSPTPPPTTCGVSIALELWLSESVEPLAREIFGTGVARIEHLGAFSCRRMYGRAEGRWSEHATGNAVDIAAFVLDDGTRVSVLNDWSGRDVDKALFLRRARDGACAAFATVLSPDYNDAHADHFHLDMAERWGGVCR